jgi:transposase-like protein
LAPYQELPYAVLATLSDGEKAIIAALKTCWPDAPRQRCQEHYLGNLAESVLEEDRKVQEWMRNELGGLPAVPMESETTAVQDDGGQSTAAPPLSRTGQSSGMQD